MNGGSREWTLEGCDLKIGEARFWECDVEVIVDEEYLYRQAVARDYSGKITFTHPVDSEMFFEGEHHLPVSLDALATTEGAELEIEGMLVASRPEENQLEFVARDADLTVWETDPEPTMDERAVRLLDDLACEIVDGEKEVVRIDLSQDAEANPIWRGGWKTGPTTLEIVYDE